VNSSAPAPRVVLATRNPGKAREIAAVYAHLRVRWLTLADLPPFRPAAETGATYGENAAEKALTASSAARLPALADDSGIEVDAIGGAPGVRSARFLGAAATDAERNARILDMLWDVPPERRTARYRAAVAVAVPAGSVRVFEGTCEGRIATSSRGRGGFGYDPIFVPEGEAGTMAEISAEAKNRISHRARALRAAEAYLAGVLAKPEKDRSAGSAK
jgi:XTP/dITP diphosphohydrolase